MDDGIMVAFIGPLDDDDEDAGRFLRPAVAPSDADVTESSDPRRRGAGLGGLIDFVVAATFLGALA